MQFPALYDVLAVMVIVVDAGIAVDVQDDVVLQHSRPAQHAIGHGRDLVGVVLPVVVKLAHIAI